jgi:hypothetical protein
MNEYSFCNSTVEVEARKLSGDEGVLVMFGGSKTNTSNGYRFTVGGWNNTKAGIEKVVDGHATLISSLAPISLVNSRWYKIKVVMHECKDIQCYVDGQLLCTASLPDLLPGRVQAFGGYDKANGEIVVKVVNAVDSVMNATVHINGSNIQSAGKVYTLTSGALKDENYINSPSKIVPVEETYTGFCQGVHLSVQASLAHAVSASKQTLQKPSKQVYTDYNCRQDPIRLYGAEIALSMAKSKLQRLVDIANANLVESACVTTTNSLSATTRPPNVAAADANLTDVKSATTPYPPVLLSIFKAAMSSGEDCTSKMKNPNFTSMSTDGWQGSHCPVWNIT